MYTQDKPAHLCGKKIIIIIIIKFHAITHLVLDFCHSTFFNWKKRCDIKLYIKWYVSFPES